MVTSRQFFTFFQLQDHAYQETYMSYAAVLDTVEEPSTREICALLTL